MPDPALDIDAWSALTPPDIEVIRDLNRTEGPHAVHAKHCHGLNSFRVTDGAYEVYWDCPICNDATEKSARAANTKNQIRTSGIGERYWDTTWDDLEMLEPLPALQAASCRITDIIRAGHSLILCGPPGTGKSQAAVLLTRAAIEQGHTAAFVNIGRAAMEIRAGYDTSNGITEAGETQRLSSVDLLVFDDLGAGEAGDAKIEKRILYFVTEARQNARKPTICTSNLSAKELSAFLGERVMNRLMPAEVMPFSHGKNFRRPTAKTLWHPEGPT